MIGSESLFYSWIFQRSHSAQSLAVTDANRSVTYEALQSEVEAFAEVLLAMGVERGQVAAMDDTKSIEAVVAILALLKIGAAYCPINPALPLARQQSLEKILGASFKIRLPKGEKPFITRLGNPALASNEAAYFLFTSGSTGEPKAVEISSRAALSFCNWAASEFSLRNTDIIASTAPMSFDLFTFDLFSGLASGCQVVLLPPTLLVGSEPLGANLKTAGCTVWYTTPIGLRRLDRELRKNLPLPPLRLLLSAGEAFPTAEGRRLGEATGAIVWNLYGPTETNVCTAIAIPPAGEVPIGRACAGYNIELLGEDGELVRGAGSGEIVAKGPGLFSGYRGEEKFSAEWYRTGDWAERREDGMFYFQGRKDGQVKIGGIRIYPAEVENTIRAISGVEDCAILPKKQGELGTFLWAICSPREGSALSVEEIFHELRGKLPPAMLPFEIILVEKMPTTAPGKRDLVALEKLIAEKGARA